ncbi:MAG TPA: hypothetical protein VGH28_03330 [Polyangiaceae bacterium]|jgi:hypothetical protein
MRIVLLSFVALVACGGAVTNLGGDDAGTDSQQQKQTGSVECNGQTCGEGEACVVLTAGGGACEMPDDAGICPDGTHTTGCCNGLSTTYTCTKLPDSCNGTLACPCAESLCQCGGCQVADAGVLSCECMYP